MPRLLGQAPGKETLSRGDDQAVALCPLAGGKRITDLKSDLPAAAPGEARREEALIQSTVARIIMIRRKAAQLHDSTVVCDTHQAEIGAATVELIEQLAVAALETEILDAIETDLATSRPRHCELPDEPRV